MQQVLLTDLLTNIRQDTATENSTVVTDAELTRHIKNAAALLYNKLIKARGQEYYRKEQDVSTVSGTTVYDLNTDFFQLLSVSLEYGGSWVELINYQAKDVSRYLNNAVSTGRPYVYRLTGTQPNATDATAIKDQIELLPAPTGAFSVKIRYIPVVSHEIHEGSPAIVYNGINGFERWIECTVALRVFSKLRLSAPSFLKEELAAVEEEIATIVGERDAGAAEQWRDEQEPRWHDPAAFWVRGV